MFRLEGQGSRIHERVGDPLSGVQQMSRFREGPPRETWTRALEGVEGEVRSLRGKEDVLCKQLTVSPATWFSACHPLLSLKIIIKKCTEIQLAGGFCIWHATSFKCERASREGGWGLNLAGGASFCRRRRRLADSGRRVGDGRSAGEGGFALQLLSQWESAAAAAAADAAAQTMRWWGTCGQGTPPGPRVRMRRPPLLPSPPQASPEGVSGGPAPRAADTLRHRFRATLVAPR